MDTLLREELLKEMGCLSPAMQRRVLDFAAPLVESAPRARRATSCSNSPG